MITTSQQKTSDVSTGSVVDERAEQRLRVELAQIKEDLDEAFGSIRGVRTALSDDYLPRKEFILARKAWKRYIGNER